MKLRSFLATILITISHILPAQIVINEICPANADLNYDPQYFNFSGWVELYNAGNTSINVGGYYLTDKPSKKTKWIIPPNTTITSKGFILIWCDEMNSGLHTNFDLDSEGEDVVLSRADLTEVDKIAFPVQYTNISYGRTIDGGGSWTYLINPTPAVTNNPATGTERLAKPDVALSSGRYSSTQSVTVTHEDPNATIRYTTDGAEPNQNSSTYASAVAITKTGTLKTKAFRTGFLPSDTESETYFINEHAFSLPVISISTKNDYLWGNTIGIYADGTNGKPGPCDPTPRNFNQDWERHAMLEFFDDEGEKDFGQAVDIRIGGNCTRTNPQKSFVIKARDKYGSNTMDERLFDSRESSSFGGFMFRNSGNDFWNTMFRDGLMQTLVIGQMDVDYLAYEPKIFYLNGQYWGIQNLREKIDTDYIETHYGIDKDDVDLLEGQTALEGSADGYLTYLNTLESMDLSSTEAFDYIDANIDVQEFINYQTAEIYYANTDWPGNNIKFWRKQGGGKWRWILWDLDFGFALYPDRSYATHPTLQFVTEQNGPAWPNPPWSTRHLRLLLQNPQFKNRFIQTFTTSLSTTFHPDRVVATINTLQDRIKTEMPYHATRWNQGLSNWNNEVQRLRDFANQRNEFMYDHLASFFGMNDLVNLTLSTNVSGSGGIELNGILVEGEKQPTLFKGMPFTINAVAATGYRFQHWDITSRELSVNLIGKNSSWRYSDLGTLPDLAWASEVYNDAGWAEGLATLGYGENNEQTVISFGGDANNKFITSYFRKTIDVPDTAGFTDLIGKILFDDGVVVYLNGVEVFRVNMPAGQITNSTLAETTSSENIYTSFVIPKGVIKPGSNVFAVEVHQISNTSSDLTFNLELKTQKLIDETTTTSTEVSLTQEAFADFDITAFFEPVQLQEGLVINEFSATESTLLDEKGEAEDWIELYNTGSNAIDIAGFYITDKLSNKTKYQIKPGANNETLIQPGAYAILWADEEFSDGPLHLNIKLSNDGEAIGIYQKVGEQLIKVDEVTFEKQPDRTSFSRIPNATGPFMLTRTLTPESENILLEIVSNEETPDKTVSVFPNPTSGKLEIESLTFMQSVSILSTTGRTLQQHVNLRQALSLSLDELPSGIYIVQIVIENKIVTKRIVKTGS